MPDLNATTIEAAMRIVEGTAKNMGLKVQSIPRGCCATDCEFLHNTVLHVVMLCVD